MLDKRSPYLCGGVMFVLLKQAAQSSLAAKDYRQGMSDRQSDVNLIVDMIQALRSEDYVLDKKAYKDDAFKTSVSRYVNCLSNVPKKLPFSQIPFIYSNNELVISHYSKAIEKMQMFIQVHLDPNSCKWLVKAILYTIEKDTDIKDSDRFFISPDGMPKTKADMRGMDQFYLPCVLVGVMHYIISNRKNNEYGIKTLEEWGTPQKHGKRDYSNIDTHICFDREIEVLYDCPQSAAGKKIQESNSDIECTQNVTNFTESVVTTHPANYDRDVKLYEYFKTEIQETLEYIINHNPTTQPIDRSIPCTIADLCMYSDSWLYKVKDSSIRENVIRTLQLLDEYGSYLSDEFMRICEDPNFIIVRNQSCEEGKKLREVLHPKIAELEYAIKQQYRKLYNMP